MYRLLILVLATPLCAADPAIPAARPVTLEAGSPTTLARAIEAQTGIAIDVSALDAKAVAVAGRGLPFWTALEQLASTTESRIVISRGKIALKPGRSPAPSHVTGPFRFSAREVTARSDLTNGSTSYEVGLDLTWEPGRQVFRTDGTPRITRAVDNAGKAIAIGSGGSRVPAAWTSVPLSVRPTGLTRAAKTLTLEGSIAVTMADELLTFTFPAAVGAAPAQNGVTATIVKAAADGADWVVEIELRYPKDGPVFESFESYWREGNVMRLLPPGGDPIPLTLDQNGDVLRYVAKGRAGKVGTNWRLDYRTPGAMREVEVPFVLKDVPLP